MKKIFIFLMFAFIIIGVNAQDRILTGSSAFKKALGNKTRTTEGIPGENYFQNHVSYDMDIEVDVNKKLIHGLETITYVNNSPDDLKYFVLRLYNNLFKKGNIAYVNIDPEDIGKEMMIEKIKIDGKDIKGKSEKGTLMYIFPSSPLKANSSCKIEVEWTSFVPAKTKLRGGNYNDSCLYVSYFYPQMAVYDDIKGWDHHSYNGVAEFYNEFGDFSVNIKVPENYVIWGTGELQNPSEVFSDIVLDRYNKAKNGTEEVHIIDNDLLKERNVTKHNRFLTYHFKASNVNDFTFGLSNHYNWKGKSISRGAKSNDKVFVQTAYNDSSKDFRDDMLHLTEYSIDKLSNEVYGLAFPFPEMTIFHGDGGMEAPMMSLQEGEESEYYSHIFVTSHEVAHSYFPMFIGANESYENWIDEGITTFAPTDIQLAVNDKYNSDLNNTKSFGKYASGMYDPTLSTNSNELGDSPLRVQAYIRGSVFLKFLSDMIGPDYFKKAVQEMAKNWAHKHITSEEFLRTFELVSGKDLKWYYDEWYHKNSYADLGLYGFKKKGNKGLVTVRNNTSLPIPIALTIEYKDGKKKEIYHTAEVWKNTNKYTIELKKVKNIKEVTLGNTSIPDSFPEDNIIKF
ncbi:MAG: M1 family metallopeptidase [Hyphomicrobiales bacterium]